MNRKFFLPFPPMGWNSYDYYDTTVTEDQIKANADYMAGHLKEFGWEYIVVDIEWYSYDTGTQRDKHQYIPFWRVEMDEFSRLFPCPDRFPSSANGRGFKPLADYVHGLGLKFGIHIMRGIPRIAAHTHTKILGTDRTANEIAGPNSICTWNPDMYGVIPGEKGSQEYYDSIMNLYAQWGVDLIKCDDICRMDASSAKKEIQMLHEAMKQCGRPMVFSLSPGPARIEEAWYYETNAHMWRITDDFWDDWKLLLNMFERCELWQNHVNPGSYPDCDMLPVGMLGKGFANEHPTRLTREEQITMMTLWCMFRSPLMIGGELTLLDDWTKKLLTNREVLNLLKTSENARQILRDPVHCVWHSEHTEENIQYLGVFNLSDEERAFTLSPEILDFESFTGVRFEELWTGEAFVCDTRKMTLTIAVHGAKLYRMTV